MPSGTFSSARSGKFSTAANTRVWSADRARRTGRPLRFAGRVASASTEGAPRKTSRARMRERARLRLRDYRRTGVWLGPGGHGNREAPRREDVMEGRRAAARAHSEPGHGGRSNPPTQLMNVAPPCHAASRSLRTGSDTGAQGALRALPMRLGRAPEARLEGGSHDPKRRSAVIVAVRTERFDDAADRSPGGPERGRHVHPAPETGPVTRRRAGAYPVFRTGSAFHPGSDGSARG